MRIVPLPVSSLTFEEWCAANEIDLVAEEFVPPSALYSDLSEKWRVSATNAEVMENGVLRCSSALGRTPEEALARFEHALLGKHIAINASSTSRRNAQCPCGFAKAPKS